MRLLAKLVSLPYRRKFRVWRRRNVKAEIMLANAIRAQVRVNEAFTPTQPRTEQRRFTGRDTERSIILEALLQEKAHVVLYSDRGRGKTSLANTVVENLRRNGVVVARYTCEASSTFDSIFRGLMRDLPPSMLDGPMPGGSGSGCEPAFPPRTLGAADVVALPGRISVRNLVCVIDEFDRVVDPVTRTLVADTIKQLSDQQLPIQLMILGVSESLDQLLGQHPSIQRNLVAVPLPLMTDAEVRAVLEKAADEIGMVLSPSITDQIIATAKGSPYIAQLLGLRVTQAAERRHAQSVEPQDLYEGLDRVLRGAAPEIVHHYNVLTDAGRDTAMVATLRMLAQAKHDPWGRVAFTNLTDGDISADGKTVAQDCWNGLLAFKVIRIDSTDHSRIAFCERPFLHHVLLLAAQEPAQEPAKKRGAIA